MNMVNIMNIPTLDPREIALGAESVPLNFSVDDPADVHDVHDIHEVHGVANQEGLWQE
jgi:hypothetical protein